MNTLSLVQFQDRTRGCQVLSRDEHGDKVLLRSDGRIIKLFRRKRWLSSAMFVPYATRFARASVALRKRDIKAAVVEETWRIPAIRRHAVVYPRLEGQTLRDCLCSDPSRRETLMPALARFVALLHQRGVYFRGTHFGNLLVSDAGDEFTLIDISEATFHRGPLPLAWRARNFRPLMKYPEDREALKTFGPGRFVAEYCKACDLSQKDQDALVSRLHRMDELFAPRP